jgi:hypothetical protein
MVSAPCAGITRIRFEGSSTALAVKLSALRLPCSEQSAA